MGKRVQGRIPWFAAANRGPRIRDFYRQSTHTDVPDAEHEFWRPNYLQAIKTALHRFQAQPTQSRVKT